MSSPLQREEEEGYNDAKVNERIGTQRLLKWTEMLKTVEFLSKFLKLFSPRFLIFFPLLRSLARSFIIYAHLIFFFFFHRIIENQNI